MKYKALNIKNNNNESEIEWVDLFLLQEFHQYIEFMQLITISTLSSNIRQKLKKVIFKNLCFSESRFIIKDNYFKITCQNTDLFSEYSKFSKELYMDSYNVNLKHYNSLEIDMESIIEEFENDIQIYNTYIKNLNLYRLHTIGYYIFPTIIQFTNLSSLAITTCSISYSSFKILNYTLNYLKSLSLESVIFILSTNEIFESENLILGNSLSQLTIKYCTYFETDLPWKTIKFIFNTFKNEACTPIKLPVLSIPSLRELTFSNYKVKTKTWLYDFSKLNPQLNSLTINHMDIDKSVLNLMESLIHLTNLNIICSDFEPNKWNELTYPKLLNIKSLNIDLVCETSCQFVNHLIGSCPNLKSLNYVSSVFIDSSAVMNAFLAQTAPSVFQLDYLLIHIFDAYFTSIDLKLFHSVKYLELEIREDHIMLLELPQNSTRLKKLNIRYFGINVNDDNIKKKFANIPNWSCKVHNYGVTCYRL